MSSNFAGHVGAYFAQALFWFLGFVAFLLPFGLGSGPIRAVLRGAAGGTSPAASARSFSCSSSSARSPRSSSCEVPFRGTVIQAGGIIGDLLLTFLERYLKRVGSFILLMAAFGLFLLYSTRWSWPRLQFLKGTLDTTVKEVRVRVTRYQKSEDGTRCGRRS